MTNEMKMMIEFLLYAIALLTFIYLSFMLIEVRWGLKKIKNLTQQIIPETLLFPKVTLIFSALNEEKVVAQAIQTLLKLDYPQLEIIAVNDRSTDNTGHILESFCIYPHFQAKHIHQLPSGWLGKNHALHTAAKQASGDWLLFTDADVLMQPQTIRKAISYCLENQIDHLTIYENHTNNNFWLKILLLGSYIMYTMALKPWRIRYTWSKKYLGHGAFNLVKKSVYMQCKGHGPIALECLDDMKLGELIKRNNYRQDTVDGKDYIEREWYHSMRDMIQGLRKNGFAYFNYNFWLFFMGFVFGLIFYLWPCLAILVLHGKLQILNLLNCLLMFILAFIIAKHFRQRGWLAFFYPLGIGIFFYTIWNSVMTTYRHNGIIWRDTFYPLKTLRNRK